MMLQNRFMGIFQAMILVGDIEGRQDGDFHRVDGDDLRCDLAHPGVYKPRKLR
jgi:hypothetical protein